MIKESRRVSIEFWVDEVLRLMKEGHSLRKACVWVKRWMEEAERR